MHSGKVFYALWRGSEFLKNLIMRSLLFVIAVILVIGWALGVFVYSATGIIHLLIILAIISLLLGVIRRA